MRKLHHQPNTLRSCLAVTCLLFWSHPAVWLPVYAENSTASRSLDPIRWETDLSKAYSLGIQTKRPIVVVFVTPVNSNTRYSNRIRSHVFSDAFQVLAGKAVFVLAEPDSDEMARQVFDRLELNYYPSVSVLAPCVERVVEIGRYQGCPEPDDLIRHLERWIKISKSTNS